MLELRKQFIFYQQGCLKVSQLTTPEAIDNDVVPIKVELAEVGKQRTCYCDRGFTEEEVKKIVEELRKSEADQLRVKGSNQVWG